MSGARGRRAQRAPTRSVHGRPLREAGIRFSAVSGTSVGALNGAMIVMDDLQKAEDVWNNIHFSQVMDVDDEEMRRLMNRDIPLLGAQKHPAQRGRDHPQPRL